MKRAVKWTSTDVDGHRRLTIVTVLKRNKLSFIHSMHSEIDLARLPDGIKQSKVD